MTSIRHLSLLLFVWVVAAACDSGGLKQVDAEPQAASTATPPALMRVSRERPVTLHKEGNRFAHNPIVKTNSSAKTALKAIRPNFTIPSSWTVANWYIDPANTSGCASDSNNGTSSTCGGAGVGPVVTYQQVASYWGTYSPRLQQQTTITALSGQTAAQALADPWYLSPFAEAPSGDVALIIDGKLTASCIGTMANLTAYSSGTSLAQASVTGCTLSQTSLVYDRTNPSYAWAYRNTSGAIWSFSTPLYWTAGGLESEVTTWANGDSVSVFTPGTTTGIPLINIALLTPTAGTLGSGYDAPVNLNMLVQNVAIYGPNSTSSNTYVNDVINVIGSVGFINDLSFRAFNYANTNAGASAASGGMYYVGGFNAYGASGFPYPTIYNDASVYAIDGGIVGTWAGSPYGGIVNMQGVQVDHNTILNWSYTSDPYLWNSVMCSSYIGTGVTLVMGGSSQEQSLPAPTYCAQKVIWGPGAIDFEGVSRFFYNPGAGEAASLFKNTGGMGVDGQTLVCSSYPGSTAGACNLTMSATELDTKLGATSGCLGAPGGGQVCNYGP
jgi:hypothetical protein